MKYINKSLALACGALVFACMLLLSACDRTSSPEGRMSIKLESLQQQMMDSLKQQNRAMLDSLGKIREELKEIKQQVK